MSLSRNAQHQAISARQIRLSNLAIDSVFSSSLTDMENKSGRQIYRLYRETI